MKVHTKVHNYGEGPYQGLLLLLLWLLPLSHFRHYYIINKPRRPTNPQKQAHCSLRTRRGAALNKR